LINARFPWLEPNPGNRAMSQRYSGFTRRLNEDYRTVPWVVAVVLPFLGGVERAWDPCDTAPGPGKLVKTLRSLGVDASGTSTDFFTTEVPPGVTHIICNPPYGEQRRGETAVAFIDRAIALPVRVTAMLLRVDFDSAKSRERLFGGCPSFSGKVVLLDRIKWFDGPSAPSDNHAWACWDRKHRGSPSIRYAKRCDAETRLEGVAR
jgi:hypothetical protein